ncbi:hypothetical protein MKZ38_009774 [Zalerion maritima]|uniref:Glutamyl-tRNA amidotransferase complex subunit Gta3 domain-containing protein n=1 Tax=Zalerion maritima TaxID=339359 RepID=A0AAD5RZU9_9PEZI|nr:hypothetical protein MKZ38_009774 [Zalerion maritima]
MNSSQLCHNCREALHAQLRSYRSSIPIRYRTITILSTRHQRHNRSRGATKPPGRALSSSSGSGGTKSLSEILSKPSWSVRSLLPPKSGETSQEDNVVTPQTLRHLLHLSSLPAPKTAEEEASMLSTLQSQLRFVRDIQSVDTTGVEPLRAIRDETSHGDKEIAIGLDDLQNILDQEDVVGHNKRPRRRRGLPVDTRGAEDWDPIGTASEKVGRYFVVDGGSLKGGE